MSLNCQRLDLLLDYLEKIPHTRYFNDYARDLRNKIRKTLRNICKTHGSSDMLDEYYARFHIEFAKKINNNFF